MNLRKNTVDMDALNAITDRGLRFTPPREGDIGKRRTESDVKSQPVMMVKTGHAVKKS